MVARRCGFSLIELTLVIFVIGLLAAVSAPRFSDSLRVTRLEAAAQQLAAHVKYIRRVAINEGRSTTLICEPDSDTYRSDNVETPERIGEWLSVSLRDEFDATIELIADFDSAQQLTFDFEGVPHVGATPMQQGAIVLQSQRDRFRVTIDTGTGRTSVERLPLLTGVPQSQLSGVGL